MDERTKSPHSGEQFGPQRDFWWHHDFLSLMADRWRLHAVTSLADIGCGVGHWSRLLYQFADAGAELYAIDTEPRWVDEARARFLAAYPAAPAGRMRFIVGDARSIEHGADYFDLVTCQTVLMHLEEPLACLREMVRIAKPGGLIACVEPNNFMNIMNMDSLSEAQTVESQVEKYEFWLRYHRGRMKNGLGNDAIGELVPGMFAELGLTEISVYESDRAAPHFPPYDTEEQRVLLEQYWRWRAEGKSQWDFPEVARHVRAGGGSEEFIERAWKNLGGLADLQEAWIREGKFVTAGGGLNYLISARKPLH